MKVRHKKVMDAYEKLASFKMHCTDFYILDQGGVPVIVHAEDYEPVPTEIWRDVTAECEADHAEIKHLSHSVSTAQWYGLGYYRLIKVEPQPFEIRPKAYFIVEKKETA